MKEVIDVCDGKYTLIYDDAIGSFVSLRNGELWRNLSGDKLVFSLFSEIQELRTSINKHPKWMSYPKCNPVNSVSKENAPYYTVKTTEYGNTQAMFVNGEWWSSQFSKITDCVVAWLKEDE